MRRIVMLCGGVLLLSLFLLIAPALATTWQQTRGPEGGDIQAIVFDPADSRVIYASTRGDGFFKSTDSGGSWNMLNSWPTDNIASAVAVDPTDNRTIYVGTFRGLLKSTNGGGTWTTVLPRWIYSLAIDHRNSQTVYAIEGSSGIFKSTDGGMSWSTLNIGPYFFQCLGIDPTSNQTLYAGTGAGVFKSTDGGLTWHSANSGLTNKDILSLSIDPQSPQTVYAGTRGGVFKSTTGGGSWETRDSSVSGVPITSLAIDPASPQNIYAGTSGAGLVTSTDGGDSWKALGDSQPSNGAVNVVVIDPASSQTIYAGTFGSGVFKFVTGDSWKSVNSGLTATETRSVVIDPQNPKTIFAGTFGGGVFKSIDGGGSWRDANIGLTLMNVDSLAVDPLNPQTIYAGVGSYTGADRGGVFKSTDGGASWNVIYDGGHMRVPSFAVDPGNPRTIYAGTFGQLLKSTDGGDSWQSLYALTQIVANNPIYALAVDPIDGQTIYAAANLAGVVKSTDGGASWHTANNGLPDAWRLDVFTLAIAPANHQTVYAGTIDGLFRSTDGGNSWHPVNSGSAVTKAIRSLIIDPTDPQIIHATTDQGVIKSSDGGISWIALNDGLSAPKVNGLALDPTDPHTIYAGTSGGVFKGLTLTQPTISGAPATSITAGEFYRFTPTATNASSFSITQKPSWAAFDPATGELTGTPTNLNAGTYRNIVITAVNSRATTSLQAFSITVKSDSLAPVIRTFTVKSPVNSLTVPITSLTATDDTAVRGYLVTTAAAAPVATAAWSATPPTSYTFTTAGVKRLYAWVKDGAGNASVAEATVNIDMTPPVVSAFTVKSPANAMVPITAFTGADNVAVRGYLITESPITPDPSAPGWLSTRPVSYDATTSGTKTLYAWVKDGAGNVSASKSATTTVDAELPVVTGFAAAQLINTLSIPVTSFTATDNNGIKGYLITLSATPPAATLYGWNATPPATFPVTSSGVKTLYAWAKDAAGNVSRPMTATVDIDATPPVVTAFTLKSSTNSLEVPITTLTATDNTGVTAYLVKEASTAPLATDAAWSATPPASYAFPTPGIKTLSAWVKDGAGNVSVAKAATVSIDMTPPVVTAFTVKSTANAVVPITAFTGADNIAVRGYLITETPNTPDPAAPGWLSTRPVSYAATTSGTKTLYAWVKDGAGNVSASKSATTTVDAELPVVTGFAAPQLINTLSIPVTSFTATDNNGIKGYLITLSATPPAATRLGWNATPPATFPVISSGVKTLYAWAKDAAGNVSRPMTATVDIDATPPVVTAFTLKSLVNSLEVPITTLTATDNTGVTAYLVKETSTVPLATDAAWSATSPSSYTFATSGMKTLYLWVKDGAGNVSRPKSATTTITPL